MPFQLSPGVAVVEKDLTSIVPAVSSSIGGFAGAFQWGPVMEPSAVSSENELVRRFGKPNDSNFQSFFTAANFLSYTNNLLLVRADAGGLLNAVAAPTGGVTDITMNANGSGYVSTANPPAVTIAAPDLDGGEQATAIAILSGGNIASISVTATTSNFTYATVSITGGGGQGATAEAVIDEETGEITDINIINHGSGYTDIPTVIISGDGQITPTSEDDSVVDVVIGPSSISAINVVTIGSGYSTIPSITVASPVSGVTATATAVITTTIGLKINNGEAYSQNYMNGSAIVGEFAAKYPGALGNSLKVSMADSATYSTWAYKAEFEGAPSSSDYAKQINGSSATTNDELHIIVIDEDGLFTGTRNSILERFAYVSKASDARLPDGTNNYYKNVINSRSEYIWWMDHPTNVTGSAAWGQVVQGKNFKSLTSVVSRSMVGGADDYDLLAADKQNAFALFKEAERLDVSLIMAGAADATTANFILSDVCEYRLDCVGFISPQDVSSGQPIIGGTSTQINKIIAYKEAIGKSTSYGVLDSGYKYQYDRYNDKYRYVPLNGDIAGLCARTDYTNDPWWSPGGLNRGQIKNVVRLAVNPNKQQRDTLYNSGVNPVVTFPGEGTVLFGDKTMLAKPSAFDRINVRRLFIVMEKAVATAAKFQLFEFNDSFTRAQFRNLVEPFLRDVQGRRGITDFVVKCDESNNTGEVIDRNEFVAEIFVKPNRSINFITLTFTAARSGINFSEIGG